MRDLDGVVFDVGNTLMGIDVSGSLGTGAQSTVIAGNLIGTNFSGAGALVIGLFLGYFVFDCMSWLIRESFGIAAGFVLQNGWLVSNLIGITVLLTIFAMTHVVAALMSFRMVALLPHHLPRPHRPRDPTRWPAPGTHRTTR